MFESNKIKKINNMKEIFIKNMHKDIKIGYTVKFENTVKNYIDEGKIINFLGVTDLILKLKNDSILIINMYNINMYYIDSYNYI